MRKMIRSVVLLATLLATAAAHAKTLQPGSTSGYPSRPVRVIVPYAAGGPTDVIARIFADNLSAGLGQQFYVVNHAGASSAIGTGIAAAAPADGYMLLFVTNDIAVQPALAIKLPYDPVTSLAPVTIAATSQEVIVVRPSVPAKSLKEPIALS